MFLNAIDDDDDDDIETKMMPYLSKFFTSFKKFYEGLFDVDGTSDIRFGFGWFPCPIGRLYHFHKLQTARRLVGKPLLKAECIGIGMLGFILRHTGIVRLFYGLSITTLHLCV